MARTKTTARHTGGSQVAIKQPKSSAANQALMTNVS